MTASRTTQREIARRTFLDDLAVCPGHETLTILGARWATLILDELDVGPFGHAELARRVPGATQKMLTQTLRLLERDGLVHRTVTPSVPPRVDYTLTELGRSLLPVQREVKRWGQVHMADVDDARRRYDEAHV